MNSRKALLCFLVVLLSVLRTASQGGLNQLTVLNPSDLRFDSAPNLPSCAKFALLHGNPATGASVTLARWPARCSVPKHWHTANVELMMLKGAMRLETEGGKTLRPGGYVFLPSRHQHHFPCSSECMFYLVSDGRFDIHYVDKDGKEISAEQALRASNRPRK